MSIQVGHQAPEFSLFNTDKKEIKLSELKGKNVLLLFIPFAFTGVCTSELCSIRDNMNAYTSANAEVYGISVDTPFSLKRFKEDQNYNFDLLSDFNKEAIKAYDCMYDSFAMGMKGVAKRSAFVIDQEGIIRYAEVLEDAGKVPDFNAIQAVLRTLNGFTNQLYKRSFMKKLFTLAFLSLTSIAANAQQQNAGMETWVTYTSENETLDKPEHWTGSDSITYGLENTLMLSPAHQVFEETTNVHGGSSAAKIVSHDVGSLVGVAPGILANGTITVDINNGEFTFTGGAPVTERIYFVNAWVDYQPEVDDIGMMVVQAVRAGEGVNGTDSVVGIGQFVTDGTNGYEHVSVAIEYNDADVVPDHLQIAFFSSQEIGAGYEGSTMYIDDVSFSPVSVRNSALNNNAVKCFPNPTTGMLNVQSMLNGTLTLEVYSLTGQTLHTWSFNGQTKADLSAYSNGMYFYKVSNAAGEVVKQDKLIINK